MPTNTYSAPKRIALISDPARDWKFRSLLPLLPAHLRADVLTTDHLLNGSLSLADVAAYDLVFIKTKDNPALRWLEGLQAHPSAPRLVNTLDSIFTSKDRLRAADLAASAQVPVPSHYFGPLRGIPFARFVIKSPHDDDDDKQPLAILNPQDLSASALDPGASVYAQEYIETTWEFKIYSIGGELFGFYQHPILVNPDKHQSRQPLEITPLLAELTHRTLQAVGLEVGGVDFLGSPANPLMTDVNSTQGLQNFPQGYAALTRYFDRCLAVS